MEEQAAEELDDENVDEEAEEYEEREEGEEEEDEAEVEEKGKEAKIFDINSHNFYQQLAQSYQKISAQLMSEDGMENVLKEYTKLFEAAKSWRLHGDELTDKAKHLQEELNVVQAKYSECKEFALSQRKEFLQVKEDLDVTQRLADTAHLREQNSMEVITGLRAELARISKELGYKTRPVAGDEHDTIGGMSRRAQESEMREQERMSSELAVVRERLERAVSHSRDVEKMNTDREQMIDDLAQQLEAQETETNKEMRLKERVESDLSAARSEIEQKDQDYTTLKEQFDTLFREHKALQDNYKELKTTSERMLRENEIITSRSNRVQQEMTSHRKIMLNLRIDNEQRKMIIKTMERELMVQRKDVAHADRQREMATHRAELAITAKGEAQQEVDRLRSTVINSLEHEIKLAHELAHSDIRTIERLNRDKAILSKSLQRCQELGAEQTQTLRLQEQARRAMADELDSHTIAARKQRKQISGLVLERDRLLMQTTDLELRVEETMEESRIKQMEIYEGNRRIAEGESRYRQQQNLYEAVRADRNTFAKHLLEAQDTIAELKQKLKVQGHHVEQMKEDISTKEVDLRRAMKTVDKTEKEKEGLRVELQTTRDDLSQARHAIAAAAAEERRLHSVIKDAENDYRQLMLEMEQMTNERDILGSQLVRRNDELALLYEKINLLEVMLQRGEAHYNQRLEDIRLLKIEVRRLRHEKELLQRTLDNTAKMRKEVFHLERDLTRERQKTRALEEELQNPLNVHRWRKLKGTDPTTFDLIEKVQLLQKRLLAQAAMSIEREAQLQQAQRLYAGLRQLLERQPGPEVAVILHRTQQALRERGRKLKVLAAEANMYEAQMTEFKSALEKAQGEAEELKRKNIEQRKRERKLKATVKMAAAGDAQAGAVMPYIAPPGPANGRRFLGGGFNMTPKTCA